MHPTVRGKARRPLPSAILMTEDAGNRQKAEQEGIACVSGVYTLHNRITG
jgi:exosome complex exonuclease DIS3/RRP44